MIHPLSGDLTHLKDIEIESKIHDLTRKYFLVSNVDVKNQIACLLDVYKMEMSNRNSKKWMDEYEKRNKDLDSLININ